MCHSRPTLSVIKCAAETKDQFVLTLFLRIWGLLGIIECGSVELASKE